MSWSLRARFLPAVLATVVGGLTLLEGAARITNLEAAVLVDITPKMERSGGTHSRAAGQRWAGVR